MHSGKECKPYMQHGMARHGMAPPRITCGILSYRIVSYCVVLYCIVSYRADLIVPLRAAAQLNEVDMEFCVVLAWIRHQLCMPLHNKWCACVEIIPLSNPVGNLIEHYEQAELI